MDKIAIVGEAYSGSTILSCVLGAHPDIINIGEMQELLYGLSSGVERPLCSVCRAIEKKCPFWTDEWVDKLKKSSCPHIDILKKTKARVLVDSSKYWDLLNKMIQSDYPSWLIIHIIKSPEEQVASYKMRNPKRPLYMGFEVAKNHWVKEQKYILKWCKRMRGLGCTIVTLRYRDFMMNVEGVITEILDMFGLDFKKEMLNYWESDQHFMAGNTYAVANFVEHETRRAGYVEGEDYNVERYKKRRRTLFYDDKWKEVLTAGEYIDLQNDSGVRELWNKIQTQLDFKASSGKEKKDERNLQGA